MTQTMQIDGLEITWTLGTLRQTLSGFKIGKLEEYVFQSVTGLWNLTDLMLDVWMEQRIKYNGYWTQHSRTTSMF